MAAGKVAEERCTTSVQRRVQVHRPVRTSGMRGLEDVAS
jgi:hypothetical protein